MEFFTGAAHGLSSILQMLLSCPDFLKSDPSAEQDVHLAVEFMLSLMQSNGNIAPAVDEVKHRRPEEEELVHWCHGAPGNGAQVANEKVTVRCHGKWFMMFRSARNCIVFKHL